MVNAILKVKSVKAKEKEIPMQVTTLLPQRVSVDIGDMGVLYGNLLDNAIEAAMAVEQEKRYVHVESKFQEGRLLLSKMCIRDSYRPFPSSRLSTTDRLYPGFPARLLRCDLFHSMAGRKNICPIAAGVSLRPGYGS